MPREWERLQDETSRQYRAFECYLYLEPADRTVENAWRVWKAKKPSSQSHLPSSTFRYWYHEYCWQDRARAYDDHLAKIRQREFEKSIGKEARKNAVDIERMRAELGHRFDNINERVETLLKKAEEDGKNVSLAGVAALMRVQLDIARHFLNESGESHGDPLENMSEAELVKELFKNARPQDAEEQDQGVSQDSSPDR